jgi:hypothetical protein
MLCTCHAKKNHYACEHAMQNAYVSDSMTLHENLKFM